VVASAGVARTAVAAKAAGAVGAARVAGKIKNRPKQAEDK